MAGGATTAQGLNDEAAPIGWAVGAEHAGVARLAAAAVGVAGALVKGERVARGEGAVAGRAVSGRRREKRGDKEDDT